MPGDVIFEDCDVLFEDADAEYQGFMCSGKARIIFGNPLKPSIVFSTKKPKILFGQQE